MPSATVHCGIPLCLPREPSCCGRSGRVVFPDLMLRFEQLRRVIGQPQESDVLDAIYDDMPTYNLSTSLLQQAAESAAVIELQNVLLE